MARTSDIWWHESKKCHYTTLDGRQLRLAPTLKESKTKLQQILKGSHQGPTESGLSFARLADRFLDHSKSANEGETFQVHLHFLQSFKEYVGGSSRGSARPTWTSGAAGWLTPPGRK